MRYRKFGNTGETVSALGFGCMRFPTIKENGQEHIDQEEAIRMIRHAVDNGVTYLDTAYPYHGGESETLVGKALQDGYREKVLLATKSPMWSIKKPEDFDRILNEQLGKLQTDHIDFYLLHALDADHWENVVLKFDLLSRLKKAKEDGKVRHIGFSFHDQYPVFQRIVDGFDGWEFCQIQLNYIDLEYQAGIRGLEYAASKGLGVIVMEPLLGGKLANPPQPVADALPKSKPPVEWALDFIWNRPEVSLLLSGMSTMEQVEDNIVYAGNSAVDMLSGDEVKMMGEVRQTYLSMNLVPCTKCAYCMPCPFGLDIPGVYHIYNMTASAGMEKAKEAYARLEGKADLCAKCKKCESVCPQHIESSVLMPKIAQALGE